jgi:hypothetical protein
VNAKANEDAFAFHPGSTVTLGEKVSIGDDGPSPSAAANDNKAHRGKTEWPFRALYHGGKLGVGEIENRRHWSAALRLKRIMADARGEEALDIVENDWWDLVDWRVAIEWDKLIKDPDGTFQGLHVEDFGAAEKREELRRDQGGPKKYKDTNSHDSYSCVDNGSWNVFRDLAPAALLVLNKQTVALAADWLGSDYRVLIAAIDKGWTAAMIGETEGYTLGSATARACGIGMLRSALRNLSDFFVKLDRLESGEAAVKGARSTVAQTPVKSPEGVTLNPKPAPAPPLAALWTLVGTPMWIFDGIPAAWMKTSIATQIIGANDNEDIAPNRQSAASG